MTIFGHVENTGKALLQNFGFSHILFVSYALNFWNWM